MHEQACEALCRPWGGEGGPSRGFQAQSSDAGEAGFLKAILTKNVSWEKHQEAHDEGPQPVQSKVPITFPGWEMKGCLVDTHPWSQSTSQGPGCILGSPALGPFQFCPR